MDQITYTCKGCGRPVQVEDGEVVRTCQCPTTTGVTADISAVATGEGGVEN